MPQREPIFNVPPVVILLVAAFAAVHLARSYLLSPEAEIDLLVYFAFIPARYDPTQLAGGMVPGGLAADIWTFVTYAFIHGDMMHLVVNSVWLLAFGSAVARRFGMARFLVFFAFTAAAGALAHLVTHPGSLMPMAGASAAVSGCMAAAMRFVFQMGGPLGALRRSDARAYRVPAVSLPASFRDPRIVAFLAVWFGLNLLFGIGSISIAGGQQEIAWQAHIGGFLAGLVAFAAFDPVKLSRNDQNSDIPIAPR